MCRLKTIARPYARAAFEFSSEKKIIPKWKKMLVLCSLLSQNKTINNLIISNTVSRPFLLNYIKKIFINEIDQNFENFINIILINKRFHLFPYILNNFINLCNKFNNIKNIEIISANELNNYQIKKIKIFLEKKLLSKVNLNFKIDKSLISGLKINLNNIIIDGSIQNRIFKLNNILKSS